MKSFEQPPTILFADDDPGTIEVFRYYVDSFGWAGEFVSTSRDIIRAINARISEGRDPFEALVCDIHFFDENPEAGPRISGVAAARAIREHHADLPIVFVSGYSNILLTDEIEKVRGEMFQKPIDFEALFERLAYLIRWNRSIRPAANLKENRRRASINRSGYYRRSTDQRIEVSKTLTNAAAEMRGARALNHAAAEMRTVFVEAKGEDKKNH